MKGNMGIFRNIFKSSINISEWIKNGAIIIDVRSKQEYENGHLKGAKNIPLDQLRANIPKLDKKKPIITCCASGMRSESAKTILKSSGFEKVHNGGSWMRLQKHKR